MVESDDMRDIFEERRVRLEKIIKEDDLSEEQKTLMTLAVEFGYAAAYCARTHDINGAFSRAGRYEDMYQQTLALIALEHSL